MYLSDEAAAIVSATDLTKAEKIRRLKRLDLRQADIARALGIRDQFVSNVVQREKRTSRSLAKVAAVGLRPGPRQARIQIGEAGRLVIPADFRAALGMAPGDDVLVRLEDGELRILTPRQAIRKAQQLLSDCLPADRSLAEELIAERRREAARE
jgi:AbrB family looped-hinge helix DNA binding protein